MSNINTQQEIAAPKACNPVFPRICTVAGFYFGLLLLLGALGLIAGNTGAVFVAEIPLAVYVMSISLGILILATVFCVYACRKERILVETSLLSLILCVTALIMLFALVNTSLFINSVLVFSCTAFVGILLFNAVWLIFYITGRPRRKRTTKYFTYAATFAALSVLCKILGNAVSFIPTLKFTIVYVPWVLAGIVLGPVGGMVSAGIGDFLGQLIVQNGGMPLPLLMLSNALWPLFPALAYMFLPLPKKLNFVKILIGVTVSAFVCTMVISTIAIANLYNMTFWAQFTTRLPQLIIIAINYALIVALLPVMERAKLTRIKFIEPV